MQGFPTAEPISNVFMLSSRLSRSSGTHAFVFDRDTTILSPTMLDSPLLYSSVSPFKRVSPP
ncbi:hypothetical protein AN958_06028 [Leucoagaricus sp. SymC.cos]|nr:hypothetical protein AN958_06028 [Leucoagaricus sp. SymC.cos]